MDLRMPTGILARLAVAAFGLGLGGGAGAQVERVSVGPAGVEVAGDSYEPAVSDDGLVVAFRSTSAELVAGDVNGWADIFVRDIAAGSTALVSFEPDGGPTVDDSRDPQLSDDGNLVVYETTNAASSIMPAVFDRSAGTTQRLPFAEGSLGNADAPRRARHRPAISGDGRFISFDSFDPLTNLFPSGLDATETDDNVTFDAWLLDLGNFPTVPVLRASRVPDGTAPDGDSLSTSLSDDGRYVAFHSFATDIVTGDDNAHEDVFVYDTVDDTTVLVSATAGGVPGNGDSIDATISGNGRFVVFRSQASDLVPGDDNGHWDIFVRDLVSGSTARVSVSSAGVQGDHDSTEADISDDGRFVVFTSRARNLVAGDLNARDDIFVHDRSTGETARVSVPAAGGEADGHSSGPAISGNGQWVVFESNATNLVPDDTNRASDVFRAPNPLATGGKSREGR